MYETDEYEEDTMTWLLGLQSKHGSVSIPTLKPDATTGEYVDYLKLRQDSFRRRAAWLKRAALFGPPGEDEKRLMFAGRAASRLHSAKATIGFWPLDVTPMRPPVLLLPAHAESLKEDSPKVTLTRVSSAAGVSAPSSNQARKTPSPVTKASTAITDPSLTVGTPAQSVTDRPRGAKSSAVSRNGESSSVRQEKVVNDLDKFFKERNCQVNVASQLFAALEDVLKSEQWYGARPLDVDGYHELVCPPDKPGVYLKLRRSDEPLEVIATLNRNGGKIVRLTGGLLPCINRFVKKAYADLPLHPPEVYDFPDSKVAQATVKEVKLELHQILTLQHGMTHGQVLDIIEKRCKALDKGELDVGDYEVLIKELNEHEWR